MTTMNNDHRAPARALASFTLLLAAVACPSSNHGDTDTDGELCSLDSDCQPVLELGLSQVKQFEFSWTAVDGADHYELLESAAPGEPFAPLAGDIKDESLSLTMPLHLRFQASYLLRACNNEGCTESEPVSVVGSLVEAVGYFKASNTDAGDHFGQGIALSRDGNTLAVGASYEDSSATGIDGDQASDATPLSGAVYVFVRDGMGVWSQQAYVKASNTASSDWFGDSVALSGDGNTLAVGAFGVTSGYGAVYTFVRDGMGAWSQQAHVEAPNPGSAFVFGSSVALSDDGHTLAVAAPGEGNWELEQTGAVYVFVRDGMGAWSQQAHVKASNPGQHDRFGGSVALSGNGNILAVGSPGEDSRATGIGGDQADDSAEDSGAVYVFVREGVAWSQQVYVKASNTDVADNFGGRVALSGDGRTLAVGAVGEDSSARGIGGDQADDLAEDSGAIYVFVRAGVAWSQQAYVKASNTDEHDRFGSVALSADGNVLAVGASQETSDATGVGGDQTDNTSAAPGAAYVFVRDDMGRWSQRAYVKASNWADDFGESIVLSGDGNTLAVSDPLQDGGAAGIGGAPTDYSRVDSGAVYLY